MKCKCKSGIEEWCFLFLQKHGSLHETEKSAPMETISFLIGAPLDLDMFNLFKNVSNIQK